MADIREDGSEIFHYDIPDFPLSIKKNYIPAYACITDLSIHWHEEIEITYVVSGSVYHKLNGKRVKIEAGEAIYINAKQLHLIEPGNEDCVLYCLIFHPTLLGASNFIVQKYVLPIVENEGLDYFFLRKSEKRHESALDAIIKIHELQEDPSNEMKAMRTLCELWEVLYDILPKLHDSRKPVNEDLHMIQRMLTYVHKQYANSISLEEICNAGEVGKTKGTRLFDEYLHMTPVEYLINYRLETACKLLTGTSDSVTDIALTVGFSDSSYFARIFRKRVGCSPLEYRRKGKSK